MILSNDDIKNQFGLKIYNYEASSIYAYNLGIRKDYNKTEAILANSLFSDFLKKNKLKTYTHDMYKNTWNKNIKGNWTRDIICIKFESGVKNFDETTKFFHKKKKKNFDNLVKELEKKVEKIKYETVSDEDAKKDIQDFYLKCIQAIEKNKKNILNFDNVVKELEKKVEKIKYETISDENSKIDIQDFYLECVQCIDKYKKDISVLDDLLKFAYENKNKFNKESISKEALREYYYKNGIIIKYPNIDITYKMLYRTAGKAKEGSCMFISENLYKKARNFLRMEKSDFPDEESRIVEIGAYQSLVASNIVGKVKINPENILVINDIDVSFDRNVVSVLSLMKKDQKNIIDDKVKSKMINTLFDGQALIDSSIFDQSSFFSDDEKLNGYILLRQHFCKMAAFCTDIKQFFKDYCHEHNLDYEKYTVKDIWNRNVPVNKIELITTENAMKWMKFGNEIKDFDYWCKLVSKNENIFGIVKTAHESKQGNFQRMSYQMVNALSNDNEKLQQITKCTLDYLDKLKQPDDDYLKENPKDIEDNEFIKFLKRNSTFSNDYEVLVELCKQDRTFLLSEYYRNRKKNIIYNYTKELKGGHIIQNAENLVIVGSPYAMLLAAAGDDPLKDTMFEVETSKYPAIQCYTERFADGAELAEFRSPFNSKNNIGYMRNKYPDERIKKYFNRFGKQIIAVNMIGTDFQARNNGSDQDSDSIYTTDEQTIVECAKNYYTEYPTIINDINSIPENVKQYSNILEKYADIDNKLSNAWREIGESSNLAQLCLTYSYSFSKAKQKYEDYVCILSVLAQIAIDKAKRNFDIDSEKTIREIRKEMNIDEHKYPEFWKVIEDRNRTGNAKMINKDLKCPMNFIYKLKPQENYISNYKTKPMNDFFNPYKGTDNNATRQYIAVEEIISDYGLKLLCNVVDNDDEYDSYLLLRSDFEEMLSKIVIRKNIDTYKLFSRLIDRAFCITSGQKRNSGRIKIKTNKNKSLLLKTLYRIDPESIMKCFNNKITKN